MMSVPVLRLPHAADLPLPAPATLGSAGVDLMAAIPTDSSVILKAGERAIVPTGLMLQIPYGFEGQIRPRSGLALRHGVTVLNAPGTIDADYRGEIQVLLVNISKESFVISRGLRIAQLIIAPVTAIFLVEAAELDATDRGSGGFGSTGVF